MEHPYINVHTHHNAHFNECAIFNAGTLPSQEPYYSCGIHPWDSCDITSKDWEQLTQALETPNCIALGECGLDALKPAHSLKLQEACFIKQIELANHYRKPLILHVVRTHERILHLLKKENCSVPVVFHGFNKSYKLYQKIVGEGYCISLGTALQNPHIQSYVSLLDLNCVFFETDDSRVPIQEIYTSFLMHSDLNLETLKLQILSNFKTVFQINLHS